MPAKPSKYRNKRVKVGSLTFASIKEHDRWFDLKMLERAGEISALQRQQPWPIYVNGIKVCDYICDFQYIENGALVVEDSKGVQTDMFRLKRKMVKAQYGWDIRIT